MRVEIERKFLVAHGGWRHGAIRERHLKDGLIGQFSGGKVRVRRDGERAWLTVKGARDGLARTEFEYEIPVLDAEAMLATVCTGRLIEKTRHVVPHAGLTWEIDVFHGRLDGIVLAEIELSREDQAFEHPDWLGREVSGDPRFRQSALLHLYGRGERPVTMADILACPAA